LTHQSRIEILKANLDHADYTPQEAVKSTILTEPGVLDEPLQIRKARALALFLKEAPIHIYPEEPIVGIPFIERPPQEAEETPLRSLPRRAPRGRATSTEPIGGYPRAWATCPTSP